MRPHAPKTLALTAYDAGALSPARKAQLERHLEACETCRTELSSIQLWTRESQRIRAIKSVPVDFSKMELALAREAKAQAKVAQDERSNRRLLPMLAPVALAAAVLLTLGLDRALNVVGSAPDVPLAVTPPVAIAAPVEAQVVLVAGAAAIRGREAPMRAGESVRAPSVLDVDGEAHLALGPGLVAAALPDSAVALVELTTERAELELMHGTLAVRTLSSREGPEAFHASRRVVVLAAGYTIEAETATFEIELPPDGPVDASSASGVAVLVHEGSVRVRGAGTDELLHAPARFLPPSGLSGSVSASRAPAFAEGALAVLRIEREGAVAWVMGEREVEGDGSLSVLAPVGPVELVALDGLGRRYALSYILGADGFIDAGAPLTPTAPTVRGFLDPTVINAVVNGSRPSLQRCYEHALRLRPELGGGALRIRVTLATDGSVTRTHVEGGDAPATLEDCVTSEATRWSFPSPGGPMSFDLPLRFRAR